MVTQKLTQEDTKIEPKIKAYEGRWGWHSLPHSSYLQLKTLHKWVFESYKQHCNFNKWLQHPKTEDKPKTDTTFTQQYNYYKDIQQPCTMIHYLKNKKTKTKERVEIPSTLKDEKATHNKWSAPHPIVPKIIDSYNICRMPKETPQEIQETPLSIEEIATIYEKVILNNN